MTITLSDLFIYTDDFEEVAKQTIIVKRIHGVVYVIKNRYGPTTPQAAMGLMETNAICMD